MSFFTLDYALFIPVFKSDKVIFSTTIKFIFPRINQTFRAHLLRRCAISSRLLPQFIRPGSLVGAHPKIINYFCSITIIEHGTSETISVWFLYLIHLQIVYNTCHFYTPTSFYTISIHFSLIYKAYNSAVLSESE